MADKVSPEARVTAQILEHLENGVRPWVQPWAGGSSDMPIRSNGEAYRGVNVLLLWMSGAASSFTSNRWMTYQQAKALGGQVRGGQTGTYIVKYGQTVIEADQSKPDDDSQKRTRGWLRGYTVFNTDQIDNLPGEFYPLASTHEGVPGVDWNERLEQDLARTGADISWSGASAYYAPAQDHIRMPDRHLFADAEQAYSTLCHELVHWTGAAHRLKRDFGNDRAAYAREELVAEMGAAFLGSRLGFRPDHIEDHAAYLSHWIKVLRADSRAILRAASKAQAATDYILGLVGGQHTVNRLAA